MLRRVYLILILALIALSAFLYQRLVFNFRGQVYSKEEMPAADTGEVFLKYNIPYKETLFLNIKTPRALPLGKLTFNDNIIVPRQTILRGVTYSYYIYIPEDYVSVGRNYLKLSLSWSPKVNIDVRLYNYRKRISGNLSAFFIDSHIFKAKKSFLNILFIVMGLILICFSLTAALRYIFLSRQKIYLYIFLSFLPGNIFLILVYLIPLSLGYRIAMSGGYFFFLQVAAIILSSAVILSFRFLRTRDQEDSGNVFFPLFSRGANKIFAWLRTREFSDKCILLFMFLLINCALFLIINLEPVAEQLANIAYFALVTGVVIKFIKMVREKS